MTTLTTKTISGIHSLNGKTLNYKVDAIRNDNSRDLQGRWIVAVNGRAIRWYAMESAALRCVRKAVVGAYGISFGEAF